MWGFFNFPRRNGLQSGSQVFDKEFVEGSCSFHHIQALRLVGTVGRLTDGNPCQDLGVFTNAINEFRFKRQNSLYIEVTFRIERQRFPASKASSSLPFWCIKNGASILNSVVGRKVEHGSKHGAEIFSMRLYPVPGVISEKVAIRLELVIARYGDTFWNPLLKFI